jgi:hypothetical protein
MGLGEPSPWVWLRDGTDRLFHAVSVWELPPEEDGPVAVCGRRVQVVSLFDEPAGGRCPTCVAATSENEGAAGNGGGTRASEARGRDEQRPDVQYGVGVGVGVAAAAGGGAAY